MPTSEELHTMTPEQLGELTGLLQAFMSMHGLNVGFTLTIHDGQGIRTMGNVSPEGQLEAAEMIVERMRPGGEGADESYEIPAGAPAIAPNKH